MGGLRVPRLSIRASLPGASPSSQLRALPTLMPMPNLVSKLAPTPKVALMLALALALA